MARNTTRWSQQTQHHWEKACRGQQKGLPSRFPPPHSRDRIADQVLVRALAGPEKNRTHVQSEVIEKSSSSAQAILKELENSSTEDVKIEIALFKQVQVATATLRGHIKN